MSLANAQRPWRLAIAAAIAGHIVLGAALAIAWSATRAPPPPVGETILIDLTPIAEAPAVEPPTPGPPNPSPAPRTPPQSPNVLPEVSPSAPQPDVEPVRDAVEDAPPRPSPQSSASARVPDSWIGQLLRRLGRFQRYPDDARARGAEGVAHVRFALDRAGNVSRVRIERSAGDAALDAEALALISRATPLPRLPNSVTAESVEVVVPIEFYLRR